MLNVRTDGFWSFVQKYPIFTYFLNKLSSSIAINDNNNNGLRNFDKCNKWSQSDIFVLKNF